MRTVVLASYNGAPYIGAQLDSIIAQLDPVDEVIVSDDASSDGTAAIVGQRSDPRIRLIVNGTRLGYVKNFERAIAIARGEYIYFSDQDDVWLPRKVSLVDSRLSRKACVVSDAVVVDRDLRELYHSFFSQRQVRSFEFAAIFKRPCFIGATMACRASYLRSLLPLPAKVPHDFWITLNATWDDELAIIEEPLILYRRHSQTASVSATARKRPLSTKLAERCRIASAMLYRRIAAIISNRR